MQQNYRPLPPQLRSVYRKADDGRKAAGLPRHRRQSQTAAADASAFAAGGLTLLGVILGYTVHGVFPHYGFVGAGLMPAGMTGRMALLLKMPEYPYSLSGTFTTRR